MPGHATTMIHRTPAGKSSGNNNNNNSNGHNHTTSTSRSSRLPLHHDTSSAASLSTTSNFLLGGNYYPGKDKRRKGRFHRKQRRIRGQTTVGRLVVKLRRTTEHLQTSWRHTSRPKRVLLVALLGVAFLVLVLVLARRGRRKHWADRLPIVRSLVKGKHEWWWKRDIVAQLDRVVAAGGGALSSSSTNMQLPTRKRAKAMAEELELQRQRLVEREQQHGTTTTTTTRLELLAKIAPEWYHRNDGSKAKHHQALRTKEKTHHQTTPPPMKKVELAPPPVKANNQHNNDKATPQPRVLSSSSQNATKTTTTTSTSTTPSRVLLRTLENMDWDNVTVRCNCPTHLEENDIMTTLVTQASVDRAWVLEETCLRWWDPIVAVIALRPKQDERQFFAWQRSVQEKCAHLVIVPYTLTTNEDDPVRYPVNRLRNLALDHVRTSHVLVADVDFVPSRHLDKEVREIILWRRRVRRQEEQQKEMPLLRYNKEHFDALVVPAFERVLDVPCATVDDCQEHLRSNHSFIPNTFDDLRQCVKEEHCRVFQSDNNWEGHFSTQSQRWLAKDWYEQPVEKDKVDETAGTTDVKSISCFDSLRYEPYVVIRWCPATSVNSGHAPRPIAPYYDERFHGYGKNKIEYVAHLRLAWYQFAILPKGFIVHNPHVESKSKQAWNNVSAADLHKDMDELYPVFLKELIYKYHGKRRQQQENSTAEDSAVGQRPSHPEHIVDTCQSQV